MPTSPLHNPPKTIERRPPPISAAPNANRPPTPAGLAALRGPSILLLGPPGGGKSTSLATLIEAGLTLYCIVTEPNGLEALVDQMARKGLSPDKLRYRVIEPAREGFDALGDMAQQVTQMGYDGLSKMQPTERSKAQFLQVIAACRNFRDDRTGQEYGNISALGPDSAFALDSLSGLNLMAMDLAIGNKVTAHQGEWGVAMNMLDKLLLTLTSNLKCTFVLTGHVEPERDEITGSVKLMAATLGRKLAPKIPRFFSEVVLAYHTDRYYWSTTNPNIDLKHRSLPSHAQLAPTFSPIITAYRERLKSLGVTQ